MRRSGRSRAHDGNITTGARKRRFQFASDIASEFMESAAVAVDAEDVAHTLELREHARELLDTRDEKGRVDRCALVRICQGRERNERDLVLADDRGDVAQEAVAVPAFDA